MAASSAGGASKWNFKFHQDLGVSDPKQSDGSITKEVICTYPFNEIPSAQGAKSEIVPFGHPPAIKPNKSFFPIQTSSPAAQHLGFDALCRVVAAFSEKGDNLQKKIVTDVDTMTNIFHLLRIANLGDHEGAYRDFSMDITVQVTGDTIFLATQSVDSLRVHKDRRKGNLNLAQHQHDAAYTHLRDQCLQCCQSLAAKGNIVYRKAVQYKLQDLYLFVQDDLQATNSQFHSYSEAPLDLALKLILDGSDRTPNDVDRHRALILKAWWDSEWRKSNIAPVSTHCSNAAPLGGRVVVDGLRTWTDTDWSHKKTYVFPLLWFSDSSHAIVLLYTHSFTKGRRENLRFKAIGFYPGRYIPSGSIHKARSFTCGERMDDLPEFKEEGTHASEAQVVGSVSSDVAQGNAMSGLNLASPGISTASSSYSPPRGQSPMSFESPLSRTPSGPRKPDWALIMPSTHWNPLSRTAQYPATQFTWSAQVPKQSLLQQQPQQIKQGKFSDQSPFPEYTNGYQNSSPAFETLMNGPKSQISGQKKANNDQIDLSVRGSSRPDEGSDYLSTPYSASSGELSRARGTSLISESQHLHSNDEFVYNQQSLTTALRQSIGSGGQRNQMRNIIGPSPFLTPLPMSSRRPPVSPEQLASQNTSRRTVSGVPEPPPSHNASHTSVGHRSVSSSQVPVPGAANMHPHTPHKQTSNHPATPTQNAPTSSTIPVVVTAKAETLERWERESQPVLTLLVDLLGRVRDKVLQDAGHGASDNSHRPRRYRLGVVGQGGIHTIEETGEVTVTQENERIVFFNDVTQSAGTPDELVSNETCNSLSLNH